MVVYTLQVSSLGQEVAELGRIMRNLAFLIESMMASSQTPKICSPLCTPGHSSASSNPPEGQATPWIIHPPPSQIHPGGHATVRAQEPDIVCISPAPCSSNVSHPVALSTSPLTDLSTGTLLLRSPLSGPVTLRSRSLSLDTPSVHLHPPPNTPGTLPRAGQTSMGEGRGHSPPGFVAAEL